jgi:hypothetical protein
MVPKLIQGIVDCILMENAHLHLLEQSLFDPVPADQQLITANTAIEMLRAAVFRVVSAGAVPSNDDEVPAALPTFQEAAEKVGTGDGPW